jgi:hypothetical protein
MTTLTFLGSYISYQPTCIKTKVDPSNLVKYRGASYTPHQAIAQMTAKKGLKFRGVAY